MDISDTNRSDIDVDEIMRRIRSEVDARRATAPPELRSAAAITVLDASSAWRALDEAARSAEIGADLPDLSHLNPLKRAAGKAATRAILRLGVVLRTRQSQFNQSVVKVLRHLTANAERLESEIAGLNTQLAGLEPRFLEVNAQVETIHARLSELSSEDDRRAERTGLRLGQLDARMDALARRSEPALAGPTAQGSAPSPGALDGLHAALMEDLRGPVDDIRARLRVHLEHIEAAGAGTTDAPVLDVGCGRGEWLELLAERGWSGRGVDTNPIFVARCRELGLDVEERDAMGTLRNTTDGSLGAVTAFHVVEHLPFAELVRFLDESVRVLRPGGIVILETPNPDNLTVGATTFWLDPTHQHPLPSGLLRFVAEARGLTVVDVVPLHPLDAAELPDDASAVPAVLHKRLFGPRDYALIARKP